MNKLKEKFGFEFWQKFGKALMVVIAVMPAAGLMISLGKTVAMINPNVAPLVITGGFLEQIGGGLLVTFTSCSPLPLVVAGLRNVQAVPLRQVLPLS
jgi:phosphotransferase system  glucose/maltose/N-acetylglucosamine-specific IIC component